MHIPPPDTWGTRTQISATAKEIADLEGNRDGLWDNESAAAGTTGSALARNSLAVKLRAFAAAGLGTADEVERLKTFLAHAEEGWGQPVLAPEVQSQLRDADLFAVQKAIALKRMGRAPDTVIDAFVSAKGSVHGEPIALRRIFTQHFKPTAAPTGSMIVVAPGYLETGRNFYEQIARWNAAGHDVVVMDQQWAGQSDGAPGTVDRGFGIMRDVAAVSAYAAELAQKTYGDRGRLAIYGNSMGGLGVLGAYVLNRAGLIALDGPAMPKDPVVITQSAYLGATPTLRNRAFAALSHIPVLSQIRLPLTEGLPSLTTDRRAEHMVAQGGALENIKAQPATFSAVEADIAFLKDLVLEDPPPPGVITMVHADRDPLASFAAVEWLVDAVGTDTIKLVKVASRDHVLEQSPSQLHHAVDAVNQALARPQ